MPLYSDTHKMNGYMMSMSFLVSTLLVLVIGVLPATARPTSTSSLTPAQIRRLNTALRHPDSMHLLGFVDTSSNRARPSDSIPSFENRMDGSTFKLFQTRAVSLLGAEQQTESMRPRHLFETPAWQELDPDLGRVGSHVYVETRYFKHSVVVLGHPVLDGAQVLGAPRMLRMLKSSHPKLMQVGLGEVTHAHTGPSRVLTPLGDFTISAQLAVARATVRVDIDSLSADLFLHPTHYAKRSWVHESVVPGLTPVYLVSLPDHHGRSMGTAMVNAVTGTVFRTPISKTSSLESLASDRVSRMLHHYSQVSGASPPPLAPLSRDEVMQALFDSEHQEKTSRLLEEQWESKTRIAAEAFAEKRRHHLLSVSDEGPAPIPRSEQPGSSSTERELLQQTATATVYSSDYRTTRTVTLDNLLSNAAGQPLRGKYFKTFNCCFKLACLTGTDQATCPQRCATDSDASSAVFDAPELTVAVKSMNVLSLRRAIFDKYDSSVDSPITLYFKGPMCVPAPGALIGVNGVVDNTPDPLTAASLNDSSAEVNAYYESSIALKNVRALMGTTWCQNDRSLQCDPTTGEPLYGTDGQPKSFRVELNANPPESMLKILASVVQDSSIDKAVGASPGNPIRWKEQDYVFNAFYSYPMYYTIVEDFKFTVPNAPEIDYAFMRYFNGKRKTDNIYDLSYDRSVVHHEFHHAVTHSLNPGLLLAPLWACVDTAGAHTFASALHEAYSDYYAAIYNGDGTIGPTVEVIREVDPQLNRNTCPESLTSAPHNDGMTWVASNLEIRAAYVKANPDHGTSYDKLLLEAIALAPMDVNYYTHAEAIANLLSTHTTLSFGKDSIFLRIMQERGIYTERCQKRIIDFGRFSQMTRDSNIAFIYHTQFRTLSTSLATNGFYPGHVQLKYRLPDRAKDDSNLILRWQQVILHGGTTTMGGSFDYSAVGYDDLWVVIRSYCPIEWTLNAATYADAQKVPDSRFKSYESVVPSICSDPARPTIRNSLAQSDLIIPKVTGTGNQFVWNAEATIPVGGTPKDQDVYYQIVTSDNILNVFLTRIGELGADFDRFLQSWTAGVTNFSHQDPDQQLSTGAIVGIVIGSVAGAVVLGGGLFVLVTVFLKRRKPHTPSRSSMTQNSDLGSSVASNGDRELETRAGSSSSTTTIEIESAASPTTEARSNGSQDSDGDQSSSSAHDEVTST